MDDIKIASKTKNNTTSKQKGRNFWQYMFDIIIKTLLCAAIILTNFILFANSGSYNIFSSSMYGNLEILYIFAGITGISFILVFFASLIRPLENILLATIFGLFTVVIINQFATFDKQSALLLLFEGIFSNEVNIILYSYSQLIIFGVVFLISWIILSLLSRSFLFYLTVGICGLLGWLISEAYLNPQIKYFNDVASLPNLKKEDMGKNFIFLSFNDLTSVNNIKKINSDKNSDLNDQAYNNALGFYHKNNFTLYPNALVQDIDDPFANLISSYNSEDLTQLAEYNTLSSIVKEPYFNFKTLQNNKIQLMNNALYDLLRKDDYKINVFQTRDIDTCYVNYKLNVSSCKEKILSPISFEADHFTTFDKMIVLIGQWLESTKLIKSVNPVLKLLEYGKPYIPQEFSSKNVDLGKIYSYNSIKIFDQIIDTIDKLSGNQAYFAIIDLPSDNYVYDEYCQIKPVDSWMSAKNNFSPRSSLGNRQKAYLDQLNCLYGSLEKFIKQLDIMGQTENTTIVIQGLNNPIELIGKNAEFYKQIQNKQQVSLAVKLPQDTQSKIDYSVCSVPEFINSIFFSKKPCNNFAVLKTTDKNIEMVKKSVNADKISETTLKKAVTLFNTWFNIWSINNNFQDHDVNIKSSTNTIIKEAPVMDEAIEDIPETEMESIKAASDETNTKELINEAKEDATTVETVENIKEEIVDTIQKTNEEVVKKPSKLEELAKNTYKEINSKVDEVIKNKKSNKKENLIDKINNATQKLSSDINNTIKNVTDKVSDALTSSEKPEDAKATTTENDIVPVVKNNKADIIAETKKAIKEKEAALKEKTDKLLEEELKIKEQTSAQSPELKSILEAPVADGQNLSPEELKKLYHQKLKNAVKNSNVQVEVIER